MYYTRRTCRRVIRAAYDMEIKGRIKLEREPRVLVEIFSNARGI